jgi:lysophospholipase L1-like esterase
VAQRRTSRWRTAALAAFVGGPLLFVAIEGALRLAGVEAQPRVLVDPRQCYLEFEPGTHVRRTLNGLVHDLWLDGRGFRVREAVARGEETVPPARCRILALGDSFTEGFFVTADEAWPAQVERRLRAQGYDVRVDNGGFRSRSIIDERFAALTRWQPLRHDVVVLQHTTNDIEDLVYAQRSGCVAPRFTLLQDWRIRRLADDLAARLPFGRAAAHADPPTASECRAMSREYAAQVVEMARAIRADGRRILFAQVEPFWCSGLGDLDPAQYGGMWHEYTRRVHAALAAAGADVADVSDALRAPGRSLRPADSHPNAAGHAAIADGIAGALVTSGALTACKTAAALAP